MPDEWAAEWDDDADDSDSEPLPPAHYNADAELARELDLSRVWEPAALKVTETPFTIANRQRRVSEANGGGGGGVKGKGKSTTTNQAIGRPGDQQSTGGPSRSTTTTSKANAKKNDPPPPPPKRRGPVPAKSGKLFGVDPPEEKKEAVKKTTKKWTKAELDGWKDANGNPIPSTKPSGKKGAAAKPKKSILDLLEESAEKTKGGKGGKGKGKKGAQVTVPAVGAGVELPDEVEVPPKKKRAPAKKKTEAEEGGEGKAVKKRAPAKKKQVQKEDEVDELESEEEAVVAVKKGKGKAPLKKKTQQKEEEVDELMTEEEEQVVVAKKGKAPAKKKKVEVVEVLDDDVVDVSDDEPDSLVEELLSKKRAKEKEAGMEDDDERPVKKGKAGSKAAAKGKGKGKAKADDDEIRFTRLPAGAEASDEYPIVKLLEHQKTLPANPKSKPAAKPKPGKATKKAKPPAPMSSSSQMNEMDTLAFLNSLADRKDSGGSSESTIPIEQLIPALQTSHLLKRKKRDSEGGESVDPDESEEEENERVQIGSQDDEEEGKRGLMSRYFARAGEDGEQTAPTTLDPESLPPDSSSALPHSSPTERRALKRQDSDLVHPQPVRNIPLPNADKFEHLAKLAEKSRREAEGKKDKIKRKEADVTSYMRKGMTIAQPPMSTNRLHRPRSPQPQIDSRFREPTLRPVKPDARNTDMFRSPAYKGRSTENLAEAEDEKPEVWGTLGPAQKRAKKTAWTPYDYNPHASLSSRDDTDPASAKTISQLSKRPMFTPQAPQITIPIPKFTTKTSAGTGAYGSAASTTADEPVLDPYQRAREQEAAGQGEYRRNGIGRQAGYASGAFQDSPEVETLRGRQGTVYTIHKEKSGRYEERPRYMPATAVPLGAGDHRTGDGRDKGDWREEWKFQSKKVQEPARGVESYRASSSVAMRGTMAGGGIDEQRQAKSDWRLPTKPNGRQVGHPTLRTSASTYDQPSSSFDPRNAGRSQSRLSGNFDQEQRQYSRSPADPFRPSSRTHNATYPHSSYPPTQSTRTSSSQYVQAYPTTSSYPAEYPTQNPRPASRDTARTGNSLLARIPIATFNGSKPRPTSTVYPEAGPSRLQGRQGARGGGGWMAEQELWSDLPEAGPSNYAGYANGTGAEGVYGSQRYRVGTEYRSAGEMQWEEESYA